jgi:hypothetical protein
MPDPITNQLVDNVWGDIQTAVTSGLAPAVPYAAPAPVLDTVAVVVSTEKLSAARDWTSVEIDYPPEGVRVEQSGNAFDIMHRFELGYHDLLAPDKDAVKQWATDARQFELSLALRYYAGQASRHGYTVDQLYQADPDGWGQRRCVEFASAGRTTLPDKWEKADLERLVKTGVKAVDGIRAVVFRIAGGPYVRRPADLSLSWTPAGDRGADLLLTEQLEFVNVTSSSVFGIELIKRAAPE